MMRKRRKKFRKFISFSKLLFLCTIGWVHLYKPNPPENGVIVFDLYEVICLERNKGKMSVHVKDKLNREFIWNMTQVNMCDVKFIRDDNAGPHFYSI